MNNDFDVDFSADEDKDNDIKKKMTGIKVFIYDFDMDLQGYEWNGNKGEHVYTGKCLVDEEAKSQIIGSLKPFANDVNLITGFDQKEFSKQKYRTLSLINEICTTNRLGVPVKNKRLVINKYMNTIKLIGGIILESKAEMFKIMMGREEMQDKGVRID